MGSSTILEEDGVKRRGEKEMWTDGLADAVGRDLRHLDAGSVLRPSRRSRDRPFPG